MDAYLKNKPPRLLDQIRTVIRRKHYSIRTEQTYVDWTKRFIFFHQKRHPKEMGKREITLFLNHLAVDRKVAASTQNQALSAIVFLYREVLEQSFDWLNNLEYAKRPEKIPVVFTSEEVRNVLSCIEGVYWVITNIFSNIGNHYLRE